MPPVRREAGALQALQEDFAALHLPELRQAGALSFQGCLYGTSRSGIEDNA